MLDFIDRISMLINLAGQLKSAYDKADTAEVRAILANFQDLATDAKLEAIAAKEEIVKLREQILELKKQLGSKNDLIQKDDTLYYPKTGPGGPYCPRCYEADNKIITLQRKEKSYGGFVSSHGSGSFGADVYLECPECECDYCHQFQE